ncbi:MAG TPA: PmoA family protein [Bryobacteraceae bacterium]|nr:PmoA family protein [Bryobacteraceae bacterium]
MRIPNRITGFFFGFIAMGALAGLASAQVRVAQESDHISVQIDNTPFTDFYIGSAYPKPFLWPLRTESGLVVTRNFPMKVVPGESHDHPHHRGLFIGYGEINGVNFWENEDSYKTDNRGRIVIRKIETLKNGKKQGVVKALFEWHDPGGANIMNENRTMTFYSEPDRRTIDFDITFTAKIALHWADTKEGFFAIRLADSMNEKHGGKMVNSHGAAGEKNVWGKQASWVDYSGEVDGQPAGVAILANPKNPRFPPRWHSRAYGLFAVNPWGLAQFINDKNAQGGGLQMAPGQSMRLRYRVIIHSSNISPLNLPDLYNAYVEKSK